MKLRAFAVALVIAFAGSAASQATEAPKTVLASVAPKAACATLKNAPLSAKVGAAVRIRSAESKSIDGGQYCAVAGEIDRHIQFEVRLPTQGWSQRYVQLGCGGLCGVLNVHLEHAEDCRPANDHSLVLASTDMGHVSHGMGDGSFGAEPDARIDFAYRGVHLTSVAAQALIEAYYGQKARYRYFSGCSDGGREALIEAQRFPDDFDGIAAGAPAMNFQVQNTFYHAWMYRSNHRPDGSAILTANKLPALHAAALVSCDEADGLKDGLISDPRLCHFDPKDAQCRAGVAPTDACLTAEEVAVARKFYEGPRDAEGHRFTIGGPQVGSELAWADVFVPRSAQGFVISLSASLETLKYLAFDRVDAKFDINQFRFDRATFDQLKPLHGLYDATNTDLSSFESRGGKLMMWHGWSDPHISPINTIAYYHGVRAALGNDRADRFMRLFLFPGMYHCGGGDGFGGFDVLTPLMAWVEAGQAPSQLQASTEAPHFPDGPPPGAGPGKPPGGPMDRPMGPPPPMAAPPSHPRTRPIYAYPAVSAFTGHGSVDSASNFKAGPPLVADPSEYVWEGSGFMAPGGQKLCAVEKGQLTCH